MTECAQTFYANRRSLAHSSEEAVVPQVLDFTALFFCKP